MINELFFEISNEWVIYSALLRMKDKERAEAFEIIKALPERKKDTIRAILQKNWLCDNTR